MTVVLLTNRVQLETELLLGKGEFTFTWRHTCTHQPPLIGAHRRGRSNTLITTAYNYTVACQTLIVYILLNRGSYGQTVPFIKSFFTKNKQTHLQFGPGTCSAICLWLGYSEALLCSLLQLREGSPIQASRETRCSSMSSYMQPGQHAFDLIPTHWPFIRETC